MPTANLTKPLAGYIRVSDKGDRPDEKLRSPDFQREAIKRYARSHDFSVRFFKPEIDVSGSKKSRAVLDEIIARVKSGELGGLVVSKLDRLSRLKPKDRVLLFEEIEDAGGLILSASEQLDVSTPEGRFARDVFLGVARMQWEKYDEGFEYAKASAIKKGVPVHNRAPVGYRPRVPKPPEGTPDTRRDEDKRLVPDENVAPIIREVFERRARGEGPAALADFLAERGVTTSQGSRSWSRPAVYGLLQNRVYFGELRYGKDDRYVNPEGIDEPIVDPALWQAAQHPNGMKATVPRTSEAVYVLAGLLRCGSCGYCLQGTKTSRGKRVYRCPRRRAAGRCPAPAHVMAELVEDAAERVFWALLKEPEGKAYRDVEAALRGLRGAYEQAEQLYNEWQSPDVQAALGDASDYARGLRERREQRDAAAAALWEATAAAEAENSLPSAATLRKTRAEMTPSEWREHLRGRFDCLMLTPGKRLVVFPTGTGPAGLPRQGFKRSPTFAPLGDLPSGARMVTL